MAIGTIYSAFFSSNRHSIGDGPFSIKLLRTYPLAFRLTQVFQNYNTRVIRLEANILSSHYIFIEDLRRKSKGFWHQCKVNLTCGELVHMRDKSGGWLVQVRLGLHIKAVISGHLLIPLTPVLR